MVEVYSDTNRDPTIPNLVNAVWNSSTGYHIWQKTVHMMKVWSTTPYKSVKWFVISHDSSYLHLQNLYDSLSTRNASEPQIIGNVQCSPTGVQYPSWRASIVLSRGVFDTIVWDTFYAVERSPLRKSKYSYDVILGQYAKAMGIPVYDHPGFLGASYTSTSSLLAKYADLHKHNARGWTFPFRPISSDQTDDREFFEELHAQLNPIVAKDGEEALIYDPSPCSCKPHTQSRCWPKSEIDVNICRHTNANLECIGVTEK